jgi:2-polyprenyl-3-methyl-5-hydroxy-6-metoxy-1,4-benzoquinol methylase
MKHYCLVCHTEVRKHKKNNIYLKCSCCGLRFIQHAPNKNTIAKGLDNWAKEIIDDESGNNKPSKIINQRIDILNGLPLAKRKLLDVGCGKADFLITAKKSGFTVSGMDIAEPIIEQLKEKKIQSFRSLSDIQKNSFSTVTCFDVIEHTTNPRKFIENIHKILDSKGFLLLSTPNASSISARLLGESWWVFGPDGHYVLFTPKSIRMLLEMNGFSVVSIKTNTLTQWVHTRFQCVNRIGNKIIYCVLFFLLPSIFQSQLGDNLEVLAKKIKVRR